MRIAEGQPFSDCPSVALKVPNFTPKSPVCHWLISEKNWSWAGVSVGIRDHFASRTESDRVLPLFPRVTDNTPYLTLHNITYSLILNFVPTAPVCPHVASYRYHPEGLKEEPRPMGMRRYRPRACQSLSCLWNTVAKSRGSPLTDQDTPSLNGPERGPLPLRTLGKPDGSCSEGPDGVPLGFP